MGKIHRFSGSWRLLMAGAAFISFASCGGGGGGGGSSVAPPQGGGSLVTCPDATNKGTLPQGGNGVDLEVTGKCTVGAGTYMYQNVNIYGTNDVPASLTFQDQTIDFRAHSILVENHGSLLAGVNKKGDIRPIGTDGGSLTLRLYGADEGVHGKGIVCKSPLCGIPDDVWGNDHKEKVKLPGAGDIHDYFYQYHPLPFDDGENEQGKQGYFGYKVLAVSYGGTLELYGRKGASFNTLDPSDAGTSWGRLQGSIKPNKPDADNFLTVDVNHETRKPQHNTLDWQMGDHIVVTTTDYLADHSEELVITASPVDNRDGTFKIQYKNADPKVTTGVRWVHNGVQFSLKKPTMLPARLNITRTEAETRAAVALLTRSIRIVSAGDTSNDEFYAPDDPVHKDYFFGGHVIFRQGFQQVQVQGVEFRQLGQGGRLGHYPLHFHLARQVPSDTFVNDCSINESMTRWITIHGSQGVTLERNVGYLSIGHGFYLEDGVETNNKFYSNVGIFARAAIKNADNPRMVPGILASPDNNQSVQFRSDKDTPSVFWITNGWNDFQGNMAAGAGMCGVCFWELPAVISGPSSGQKWESYASEQTATRRGTTPLQNFDGNYCIAAMTSFQTVGYTERCPGVGPSAPAVPATNPNAPASSAAPPVCGPDGSNKNWPLCPKDYYPNITGDQLAQATKCPATGACDDRTAILCQETEESNCLPTVINDYTTSFNYAPFNFASIWLRRRWHLVSNSFISDVQNAALTFISGGDYTHSSAIKGLWDTVLKTIFVGETQPRDKDHAYASVLSPFNNDTGLKCDNTDVTAYCISANNSFVLPLFAAFGNSEHMFNIYDGPANQDSNAYLDITRFDLGGTASASVYGGVNGIPRATAAADHVAKGDCYIPNAAIGWKQPNGFYYPPTFHSRNLFFDNVDIRHFVIDPQFIPGTYKTDAKAAAARYCTQNSALFDNFSSVDRQTELSDDDGSLTGYEQTTSVNQDEFFAAPIDASECQSDDAVPDGGTARTSPYHYITSVVYPDCAKRGGPGCANWDSSCSNPTCFGVPLYREYLTGSENMSSKSQRQFSRMAGMNISQRENMTVNHAHYYIDITASAAQQSSWASKNIFEGGQTYDVFLVYGSADVEQTYQLYIGDPKFDKQDAVNLIRVDITNTPFIIGPGTGGDANTLKTSYDGKILTVTLNLSAYEKAYAAAAQNLCLPKTFCTFDMTTNKCVGAKSDLFPSLTQAERDLACSYAGKDVDCPTGGCVGFSVTLPSTFVAQDQTVKQDLLSPLLTCFPNDSDWNVMVNPASMDLAGKACYKAPLNKDFCS
jgi:hypothetical protein